MVSDSVSKKFEILKSIGFGIEKNLVSKKVSDSVSEKFGIGKKFRIRFRSDFGYRHTLMPGEAERAGAANGLCLLPRSKFPPSPV